jgi:hypothetical protein
MFLGLCIGDQVMTWGDTHFDTYAVRIATALVSLRLFDRDRTTYQVLMKLCEPSGSFPNQVLKRSSFLGVMKTHL